MEENCVMTCPYLFGSSKKSKTNFRLQQQQQRENPYLFLAIRLLTTLATSPVCIYFAAISKTLSVSQNNFPVISHSFLYLPYVLLNEILPFKPSSGRPKVTQHWGRL